MLLTSVPALWKLREGSLTPAAWAGPGCVVAYCQAAEGEYCHATHCYKEHTHNYTSYILANCIQCCRHPLISTEYCLIAKTALPHYIIPIFCQDSNCPCSRWIEIEKNFSRYYFLYLIYLELKYSFVVLSNPCLLEGTRNRYIIVS